MRVAEKWDFRDFEVGRIIFGALARFAPEIGPSTALKAAEMRPRVKVMRFSNIDARIG
jgi:hypothetical protein